jgi:hypothetical protein
MHRVQHLRDWATRRRLTASLLLVMSLLMVLPVSMQGTTSDGPLNALGKDTSSPFPCQTRACGCRSAKQCWKKCCCFTDSQKVAWAKVHRVTLPNDVVEAAKREATVAQEDHQSKEKCCLEHVRREDEAPAEPSLSEDIQSSSRLRRSVALPPQRPSVRLAVGIEALQCSGVEQTIAGVLVSIQPPELLTVVISHFGTGEVMRLADLPLAPCEQEPSTPPPRLGVA